MTTTAFQRGLGVTSEIVRAVYLGDLQNAHDAFENCGMSESEAAKAVVDERFRQRGLLYNAVPEHKW